MWFIGRGLVRFTINKDGEERTFVFRAEGAFISSGESFLQGSPSPANIIALEDTVLLSVSRENLQVFYKNVTQGERFGRLLVEDIFVHAVSHLISYYTEEPELRYKKLLRQNSDFIQRIPQYHIASFLGVKPQSLCRIKKRLQKQNL